MNIKEALLSEHSKKQTIRIINYIGNDKKRFKILSNLFLGKDPLLNQRAAWPLSYICIENPGFIKPYIGKLLKNLSHENLHDAVLRNTFRVFQEADIPERYCGIIFDLCIKNIKNPTLAHAIRVFSIGTATNICMNYPELKPELKLILKDLNSFPQAPSLKAKIKTELQRL